MTTYGHPTLICYPEVFFYHILQNKLTVPLRIDYRNKNGITGAVVRVSPIYQVIQHLLAILNSQIDRQTGPNFYKKYQNYEEIS